MDRDALSGERSEPHTGCSIEISHECCRYVGRVLKCVGGIMGFTYALASSPGPFTRALLASTWKKGLVSSVRAHAAKFHFHGIMYSSVYYLYISGVNYVMNIGWSNLWAHIVTTASSIAIVSGRYFS